MSIAASASSAATFPLAWPDPADAQLFWMRERMHWPIPVSPMMATAGAATFCEGRTRAALVEERPVVGYRIMRMNTYWYESTIAAALPREQLMARTAAFMQRLEALIPNFEAHWHGHLAEIKQHLAAWERFDLTHASLQALHAHLDESIERGARLWEIHFLVAPQSFYVISQFEEFYRDLFGAESSLDALRLLQGLDNKTVQMGHALWELSRKAVESPAVLHALDAPSSAAVLAGLQQNAEGRAFLSDLNDFLARYGQRFDLLDWTRPSWIEEPAPVLANLRAFVAPDAHNPIAESQRLAAEREQAIAQTREKLQAYPQAVRAQFETLLHAAQIGTIVTEDHNFYIDYAAMYRLRMVVLECGRRLTDLSLLDRADDVFYLTLDELRETLAAPTRRWQPTVSERKAEMDHWAQVTPPPQIGTPAALPPDNDFTRAVGKFFGGPLPTTTDTTVLRGHAGSRGIVRAPARVIRALADAHRLQRGEILVAETTAPPWTPLFATAAAIVTDTGGLLSHTAVVAREYGIPAVVGTGRATQLIRDGQLLEVDGTSGTVRLL